jgi:membrane protein DedA with SNARE-associated domain
MNFDVLIMQYGLLAIFLLLFVKGVGVPVPIPEDVILLAAAVGAADGKFNLLLAIVLVLIAVVLGQFLQFLLARGPGRTLLLRFGRFLGLTPARLDAASARVKKGGIVGITVTLLIPGIRSVGLVAAGLVGLPLRVFLPALVVSTVLSIGIHFLLGYLGGSLLTLLPSSPVLILVVVLVLVAFALWAIARYRQKSTRRERDAAVLEMWHEGICPACLALSVISPLRPVATELEH